MPKIKTHKALAKRVKVGARGKVKRSKAGRSHLRSGKNRKRLRHLRKKTTVKGKFSRKFKQALG